MTGDTYKILQITDTHFINSSVTNRSVLRNYSLRDDWAMTAVRAVVEKAQPDMIVLTGDAVYTLDNIKDIIGTTNNLAAFKKVVAFMDEFKIPWFYVFGNHDEEGSLLESFSEDADGNPVSRSVAVEKTKKTLGNYMIKNSKYGMFDFGPDDINGVGNYIINILNKDGSVNTSLVAFDSGSYLKDVPDKDDPTTLLYDYHNYEWVHDDQLDWYEAAIKDISEREGHLVPSIVFQHIPTPEYETVLNAFIEALGERDWHEVINVKGTPLTLKTELGEITYLGGVYNEGEVCCSYIGDYGALTFDGGHEFDRIEKLGSTKYIFCGHDHRNTYSFVYKGICLTYGMSIDYSANGMFTAKANQRIYNETEQRGGTLITLSADSSVTITQVPFDRNLYEEAVAASKNK